MILLSTLKLTTSASSLHQAPSTSVCLTFLHGPCALLTCPVIYFLSLISKVSCIFPLSSHYKAFIHSATLPIPSPYQSRTYPVSPYFTNPFYSPFPQVRLFPVFHWVCSFPTSHLTWPLHFPHLHLTRPVHFPVASPLSPLDTSLPPRQEGSKRA